MKTYLKGLVEDALASLRADGTLPPEATAEVAVKESREEGRGDFATPVALALARAARRNPRALAEAIVERLGADPRVARIEVAGPGFINFHLAPAAFRSVVGEILSRGAAYGRAAAGSGETVQVEFVSANPTGPLHVGHGRGAAYGDAVASLLEAVGSRVQREYYVNDAGRQMDILAVSVWLRYLQALGVEVRFPDNGYRGEYVRGIAAALRERDGERFRVAGDEVRTGLPPDGGEGGDREAHVDALIGRARALLGPERYRALHDFGRDAMVAEIRDDLAAFGVEFDRWYSEASLKESGAIARALARLREAGHLYERGGAEWFRSSAFGDEKDRVVVRENGETTYFASDIAYHMEKFERGFDRVIDVWGADHHGYVPRVKGALAALGRDPDRFEVLLVQFANLYRGAERVQMSTRSGEFVALRDLVAEVGRDAARFFYVMRRCEQHLDFDLELAKSRSADNPVYYVQYAHARVCSVLREAEARGLAIAGEPAAVDPAPLGEAHELALLKTLARYPEVVESAARAREPHQVAFHLREVANDFHTWYNAHTFLAGDPALREARLALALATRTVIASGLGLLGVGAPESM